MLGIITTDGEIETLEIKSREPLGGTLTPFLIMGNSPELHNLKKTKTTWISAAFRWKYKEIEDESRKWSVIPTWLMISH